MVHTFFGKNNKLVARGSVAPYFFFPEKKIISFEKIDFHSLLIGDIINENNPKKVINKEISVCVYPAIFVIKIL